MAAFPGQETQHAQGNHGGCIVQLCTAKSKEKQAQRKNSDNQESDHLNRNCFCKLYKATRVKKSFSLCDFNYLYFPFVFGV